MVIAAMVSLLVASKQIALETCLCGYKCANFVADSFAGPIGKKLRGTV